MKKILPFLMTLLLVIFIAASCPENEKMIHQLVKFINRFTNVQTGTREIRTDVAYLVYNAEKDTSMSLGMKAKILHIDSLFKAQSDYLDFTGEEVNLYYKKHHLDNSK